MPINSQRYFLRKHEYAPRVAPLESPFRNFHVQCLHCQSFGIRLKQRFDEDRGEISLILTCLRCNRTERLEANT